MLESLHIKNFALIEEADVEFGPGLNVFSGETGAGKSILIDAISAALGGRAGAEMIRSGENEAYIELVFSVDREDICRKLKELGTEPDEGLLIIKRRIQPGRSLYRINDESVSAAALRSVTELLLDIHGQHEHQSLLNPATALEILDEYAGTEALAARGALLQAYHHHREAKKAWEALSLSEEERIRRMDYLDYEIREIREAAIRPGERRELKEKHKELSAFETIESSLSRALQFISQGQENASDSLMRAYGELNKVSSLSPGLEEILHEIREAEDILSGAEQEIRTYLEDNTYDPRILREMEERLDLINRLELKYGDLCDESNEALSQRLDERSKLEDYGILREKAQKALEEAYSALQNHGNRLSELRRDAAAHFDREIEKELRLLNFLSVAFETRLTKEEEIGTNGWERVRFMVSLNPGEALQPLNKVASGGELSRIMLAIKTLLAHRDKIPSVIFDEIDSGISGKTAQMVGEQLKKIASSRQVLLITHLPQIAAGADRHYEISKSVVQGRTQTFIKLLNEKEAVEEIARLMGGDQISESVRHAASELRRKQQSLS